MGAKLTDDNRLSIRYPDIAAEWHPTANEPLTPHDVSYASSKKVWWLCKKQGHEWDAVVSSRTLQKQGCPCCAGRRATDANRLSIHFPAVAAEWHPTKNGSLTPDDVPYASHKKVWWRCKDGHEWKVEVFRRTIEKRTIKGRELKGIGCPQCAGGLSVYYPAVAAEWHPTKNGSLTPHDVRYASGKKVWWICKEGDDHEWEDTVNHRTSGRGCPFCSGKRVSDTNRLSIRFPDVAAQWHPTKNGSLTPDDVTHKSNKKVWWICKRGHEWKAIIWSRTGLQAGCRRCKLVHTSKVEIYLACELSSVFPDIDPRDTPKIAKRRVDVMIPSEKLVLEYDGALWHKGQKSYARDMRKTERLKTRGWTVIRVREEGLKPIQSHDLIVAVTFPGDDNIKLLTDNVLRHIEKVLGKDIPGVNEYLARPDLANGDLAIEIIDEPPPHPEQGRSKVEIFFRCELSAIFPDIDPRDTPEIASRRVDVMVPSERLVLEYDGVFWHKGQESYDRDLSKTEELKARGWTVIRIREEGLKPIQSHDLIVDVTFPGDDNIKLLTDNVLRHIEKVLGKDIPGVDEYIARPDLAQRDLAIEIIDEPPHPTDQHSLF